MTEENDSTVKVDSSGLHRVFRNSADRQGSIVVLAGPKAGDRFELTEEPLVVGRSDDVDFPLDDRGVSRRHLRFYAKEGNYVVEDLDSSNGTYLNGDRLTRPTPLKEGDTVGLGAESILRFTAFDHSEDPKGDAAFEDRLEELQDQHNRLQTELEAAREIQMVLIPPSHQAFAGVDLETLYRPSDEMSGDFYDTIQAGDWLYTYLIDVTSHGVASAQITYLLKGNFGQRLQSGPVPLDELIRQVQDQYADYDVEYDTAYQVTRLHTPSGRLEYLRANAPSAMHRSRGRLKPVSVRPSTTLSNQNREANIADPAQVDLSPGDEFFMFTDGCYEFQNPAGEPLGSHNFIQLLQEIPSEDWSDQLLDELTDYRGSSEFPDDLTAIRLQYTG